MKKKILLIILTLVMLISASVALIACDKLDVEVPDDPKDFVELAATAPRVKMTVSTIVDGKEEVVIIMAVDDNKFMYYNKEDGVEIYAEFDSSEVEPFKHTVTYYDETDKKIKKVTCLGLGDSEECGHFEYIALMLGKDNFIQDKEGNIVSAYNDYLASLNLEEELSEVEAYIKRAGTINSIFGEYLGVATIEGDTLSITHGEEKASLTLNEKFDIADSYDDFILAKQA